LPRYFFHITHDEPSVDDADGIELPDRRAKTPSLVSAAASGGVFASGAAQYSNLVIDGKQLGNHDPLETEEICDAQLRMADNSEGVWR
jgi:hypothetical protein